jgi:long-chain acyl-CoA synthetase
MTFVATILERCERARRRPVLYEVRGTELIAESGQQFLIKVGSVRARLRAEGVRGGDRVALLAPNSVSWAAVDLAIMAEGAICVPLYARQDPGQLAGMLRDCMPKLVIAADAALAQAIMQAWPEHGVVVRFADMLDAPQGSGASPPVQQGGPVTIIYTSGTSGEPKGVVLDSDNVDHMLRVTVRELSKMAKRRRGAERVFHYLPFCFAGSRIVLWSQLYRGRPLMLGTDLNQLQQELKTADPHFYLNVPMLLERIQRGASQRIKERGGVVAALFERALLAHATERQHGARATDRAILALARLALFPRIKRMIGESLEFLICGSAPLREDTQRWFQMLGIPVYQVYGLTETTAIATIDDTEHVRAGRVGHAIDGCELRLGEQGELLCRGPNVFRGYWNRPEASGAPLEGGWFHTGDRVEIDERGSVKLLGRVKDVLVLESGHNVAPEPIEQRLTGALSGVDQAVVVGHGRPYVAAIVTGAIPEAELQAMSDVVNADLPHYMRVRRLFRAPEPFTVENGLLTANQKLKRKAIETRYEHAIEQMYQ